MTWPQIGTGYAMRMEMTALAQLLEEHGGDLAVAAWHLARAREQARGYTDPTPSPTDLRAAAISIAAAIPMKTPSTDTLTRDARAAGLPVIG